MFHVVLLKCAIQTHGHAVFRETYILSAPNEKQLTVDGKAGSTLLAFSSGKYTVNIYKGNTISPIIKRKSNCKPSKFSLYQTNMSLICLINV